MKNAKWKTFLKTKTFTENFSYKRFDRLLFDKKEGISQSNEIKFDGIILKYVT